MPATDINFSGEAATAVGGSPVTLLLERVNRGDKDAVNELVPLVYDELRRKAAQYMSRQVPGHTLQPTALVNEAFLKLVGNAQDGRPGRWQTSRHFHHAAAEVMRQILVDHARGKAAEKRGGSLNRLPIEQAELAAGEVETDWEGLDRALAELQRVDQRRYQVVMLRYFTGLSDRQIAESLQVSEKTVQRDWQTAKLFLRAYMDEPAD